MSIWSRYTKVREINTGGTAMVYVAVDTHTGFPVAIKELNSSYFKDDFMRTKFREEANRYLYLQHPGIVGLENFVQDGNVQYLVMEFVEGTCLSDHLRSMTGPMPFQNAAYIVWQVADALAYVHAQNLVHLDVKPSNIMLKSDFTVKLIDFGIAHEAISDSLGKAMGTLPYMPREQVENTGIGPRCDIYALGITLYQLVTGRLPYPKDISTEELRKIVGTIQLPKVGAYYDTDKKWVDSMNQLLAKATAIQSSARMGSCLDFKKALTMIMQG